MQMLCEKIKISLLKNNNYLLITEFEYTFEDLQCLFSRIFILFLQVQCIDFHSLKKGKVNLSYALQDVNYIIETFHQIIYTVQHIRSFVKQIVFYCSTKIYRIWHTCYNRRTKYTAFHNYMHHLSYRNQEKIKWPVWLKVKILEKESFNLSGKNYLDTGSNNSS